MAKEKASAHQLRFLENVHESLISEQTMNLIETSLHTNRRIRAALEHKSGDDSELKLHEERQELVKSIQKLSGEDISPLLNLSYAALSEEELELLLNNPHLLEIRLEKSSVKKIKEAQSEIRELLNVGRKKEYADKIQAEELLREQLRFVRRRINNQLGMMKSVQEGSDKLKKTSLVTSLLPKILKLVEGSIPDAAKELGIESYGFEGERHYYKATLTKTIREHLEADRFDEALSMLQGFYKKLSSGLEKSTSKGESGLKEIAKELLTDARKSLQEDLNAEMQHIYGQDDAPERHKLEEFLRHGSDDRGLQIYGYTAATSLQRLEEYRLHALYDEITHPQSKVSSSYAGLMAEEYNRLQNSLESFQNREVPTKNLIESLDELIASPLDKALLKDIDEYVRFAGVQDDFTQEVMALEYPSQLAELLSNYEKIAREDLSTGDHQISDELIELSLHNATADNIFQIALNRSEYLDEKQQKEEPDERLVRQAEESLEEAKKILDGESTASVSDGSRMVSLEKDIKKITEELQQGDSLLPYDLLFEAETTFRAWKNIKRFEFTRKECASVDINNPQQMRKAMSALMGEVMGIDATKRSHCDRFSMLATQSHPVTSIAMKRGKAEPRESNYRKGMVMLNDINGNLTLADRPASFNDRSKVLMEKVKLMIEAGNYAGISELFADNQEGGRLFDDVSDFPMAFLRSDKTRRRLFFKDVEVEEEGQKKTQTIQTRNKKIPKVFYDSYPKIAKMDEEFTESEDYKIFTNHNEWNQSQRLLDAEGYQEDVLDQKHANELCEVAAGVPLAQLNDLRKSTAVPIPEDKLKYWGEKDPLYRKYAGLTGSIGTGIALGVAHRLSRYAYDTATFVPRVGFIAGQQYKDSITKFSSMGVWTGFWEAVEHIGGIGDFNAQIDAYALLSSAFEGSLYGAEFKKLYNQKEDERVGQYVSAYEDYANSDIIDLLYNARDQFEMKAVLKHGMENTGLVNLNHLLDKRFLERLNAIIKTDKIPIKNINFGIVMTNEAERNKVRGYIKAAVDGLWGEPTWQNWLSATGSKLKSKRDENKQFALTTSPGEKLDDYSKWWKLLRTPKGIDELKTFHPGELLGKIEGDMENGHHDSGINWAIFQVMVVKGIFTSVDMETFRNDHGNDIPFQAIYDQNQAIHSGLAEFCEKAIKKDFNDKNPLVEFFMGYKAIPLKAQWNNGKWAIANDEEKARNAELVPLTAHEAQKARQADANSMHVKCDNSCAGIAASSYDIQEIMQAQAPGTNGDIIGARNHNIVSGYRGWQYKFMGYLESLMNDSDNMNQRQFDITCYQAYLAMSSCCGHAMFLARENSRHHMDHQINISDGSPQFGEKKHKETLQKTGQSNFQKYILSCSGNNQRMRQTEGLMDKSIMNDGLRVAAKSLFGFDCDPTMRFDSRTGKQSDSGSYCSDAVKSYNPADRFKKAVQEFLIQVEGIAAKSNGRLKSNISESGIDKFTIKNEDKVKMVNEWKMKTFKSPVQGFDDGVPAGIEEGKELAKSAA